MFWLQDCPNLKFLAITAKTSDCIWKMWSNSFCHPFATSWVISERAFQFSTFSMNTAWLGSSHLAALWKIACAIHVGPIYPAQHAQHTLKLSDSQTLCLGPISVSDAHAGESFKVSCWTLGASAVTYSSMRRMLLFGSTCRESHNDMLK